MGVLFPKNQQQLVDYSQKLASKALGFSNNRIGWQAFTELGQLLAWTRRNDNDPITKQDVQRIAQGDVLGFIRHRLDNDAVEAPVSEDLPAPWGDPQSEDLSPPEGNLDYVAGDGFVISKESE